MRKNEIRVGGYYRAKVNDKVVTVRVDAIRSQATGLHRKPERDVYEVVNLATGRKTTFRSAAKFRCECDASGHPMSEGKPPFAPTAKTRAKIPTTPPASTTAATAEAPLPGGNEKRTTQVRAAIRNRNGTSRPVYGTPTLDGGLIEDGTDGPIRHEPGTWFPSRPAGPAGQEDVEDEQGSDPTPVVGPAESAEGSSTRKTPTPAATHHQCQCPKPEVQAAYPKNLCKRCGGETELPSAPASASTQASSADCADAPTAGPNEQQHGSPLAGALRRSLAAATDNGDNAPHLIVEARAGTGKTTTLVCALQVLMGQQPTDAKGRPITPSPQQQAVWDAVALSRGKARSVAFCAFNKSIATELQARVPKGCDAMTMHSLGYKAVRAAYGNVKPESWRVTNIISELLEVDSRQLRREEPLLIQATEKLVGLCKMNLIEPTLKPDGTGYQCWAEALGQLAAHYDVDLNGSRDKVFELVPRVLERCKDVKADNQIDFDDMIWLPVVLNLPVQRYDLLLVDEAQDLNRCQQALAKRAGKRLVLCGDPKQAIYGFAGADSQSMDRMHKELACPGEEFDMPCGDGVPCQGVVRLPLTVTRRCGRAIVAEANKYVPDFHAHESNPEGAIRQAVYEDKERPERCYHKDVGDGDMVLCRVNAPLVSQCFRFLKAGRKANIQGRDVGAGLISTIKKLKSESVVGLIAKLDDWHKREVDKEQAKRNPSEARVIALDDRRDCIACFTEGCTTVEAVIAKIESVFTDNKDAKGIRLSSIHKAKGLEADNVWFLMPKGAGCPHPMAKSPWQREQEMNLLYVGITRAIHTLTYVR